jgi:hypothetical protein
MTYDLLIGIIALFLSVSYIIYRIVDIANSSCAELDTNTAKLAGVDTKELQSELCCISRNAKSALHPQRDLSVASGSSKHASTPSMD